LKGEDVDPVVLIGLGGSFLLSLVFVILTTIYLIKGILNQEPYYKCRVCENKFPTGPMILPTMPDDEYLMKLVRKAPKKV